MDQISLFLRQFGLLLAIGLFGVGLLIYGLWDTLLPDPVTVEIIKQGDVSGVTADSDSYILVDVSGGVLRPGVYKLPTSSRVGDALVAAGGLSIQADRSWVGKTLNLAKEVQDGEKIYIPELSIPGEARIQAVGGGNTSASAQAGLTNINSASESELDSLNGIGAVRAKAIINNRPYASIEELLTKAEIPQSVYDKIKDQISIY